MKKPLSVGAFTVPHSPTLPLSEIPITELLESPVSDKSLADELRRLFTQNPATFYHATSDFYMLKKNTRIPEICILGRSNVGKSTFVNAIANRREKELAHTSARAGRTKSMNAFGFGPAPTVKELAEADPETKKTEDLPKHQFFVVDMPGYGYKSLQDWGKHISLYLNKRQAVKGAVLLIDGEVGPKSGDIMALELLQSAGVKTAIVLTKADKAVHEEVLKNTCKEMWMAMRDIHARDPNSKWEWERDFFVTALGATKKEIGAETVAIARLAIARLAGLVKEKDRLELASTKGFSGDIVSFDDLQFAPSKSTQKPTTLQEPTYSNSALTALEQAAIEQHRTRMAVNRPAGDKRAPPQRRVPVSQPVTQAVGRIRRSIIRRSSPASRQSRDSISQSRVAATGSQGSALDALERAAGEQYKHNSTFRLSTNTPTNRFRAPNPRQHKAHFIHMSHHSRIQARNLNTAPGKEPLSSEELREVLREFAASLKADSTPRDRAEASRRNRQRDTPKPKIWNPTFVPPAKKQQQEKKTAQKRHIKIYEARLGREELRVYRESGRKQQQDERERLAEKHGTKKLRDDLSQPDALDAEGLAESWNQIEEAQELKERVMHGKKAKRARRNEEKADRKQEKQKKQRKEHLLDDEDDPFAAKFKNVR